MKKYYLMAMENNNSDAMFQLGSYYMIYENNYDKMKECYLMALDQGETLIMYYFESYYQSHVSQSIINDAIYITNKYNSYCDVYSYINIAIIMMLTKK